MATNSYFNENTLEELIEEIKYVYQSDKRPWVIGYSGGKDSTTVVELVYKMLLTLPKAERNKNVYSRLFIDNMNSISKNIFYVIA